MALRVCLAGATGWAGSAVDRGIARTADNQWGAAVSRTHTAHFLAQVLGEARRG